MGLITEANSFKEFIFQEINSADGSLSDEIKNYLTELLSFYLLTNRLFEYKPEKGCHYEETLTELYGKLQEAQLHEKIYLLKKMGDFSLYTSGFFRSSIKRKIVDISYYETIGQGAYKNLAIHYEKQENVFESLSYEFKNLSEVLFYIQKKLALQKDQNCLELYEEYLETKENLILKRILEEENILP